MSQISAEAFHDTSLSPVLFREGEDRRESARIPLNRPVRVGPPGGAPESPVSARDLSEGGMFVDADRPVQLGARFSVEIPLPTGAVAYVGEAEVAYNREHVHGTGFGVRFVALDDATQARLRRTVEDHSAAVLGVTRADMTSDLPTLAPAATSRITRTPEIVHETEAPRPPALSHAPASLRLDFPPEPEVEARFSALPSVGAEEDLPIPEPANEAAAREPWRLRLRAALDGARELWARSGPGILLLAGLALLVSVALALLVDSAAPAPEVTALDLEPRAATHRVLIGEAGLDAVDASPVEAEPAAAATPKKNPLPGPDPVLPSEAPAKPKAPPAKAKAKAKAKAARGTKPMSPAARALLGATAPRIELDVGDARVLRTHVLKAPSRFVIDLITDTLPTPPAVSGVVKQVRVGRHPDYVRVVIDVAAPLEAGRLDKQGDRLTVQLFLQ